MTTSVSADVSAWLRAQENKDLLRFVTIGSVDDGKSTLIGRLLHDAHGLYEDQLSAVRRASAKGSTRGSGSTSAIDFSLVTDGLLAEREQGITIDVAYRYFATDKRKFIIADTPGHVQYTRNMATGASTAELAVILVDARLGVLPQTRRHAHIAALLGIRHVVACVNKMDLVDFDVARFEAIRAELDGIAQRLGIPSLVALPVSALAGDNVVSRSERTPWWQGPTLLAHLESVDTREAAHEAPLRFPVQLVLRPHLGYRGFAGRIVSGSIQVGDTVVALPSGKKSRVKAVDVASDFRPGSGSAFEQAGERGATHGVAHAPMNVSVRLDDEIDVSRGDMLVHPDALPTVSASIEANIVWMSERPLDTGRSYLLKHTTRTVRAHVETILSGSDVETLVPAPAAAVVLNDIARVGIRCLAPIFFDPYRVNRKSGAFILVDSVTNDTVAAGMILGAYDGAIALRGAGDVTSRAELRDAGRSQVSALERRVRFGQSGAVVQIVASNLDRARDLAFDLERALFDEGRVALVLEGESDAAQSACARGGLVAIGVAVGEDAVSVDGDVLAGDGGFLDARAIVAALDARDLFVRR